MKKGIVKKGAVKKSLSKKGGHTSMEETKITECKSCGSNALYPIASRGKDYLICEECGKVHRIK